MGFNRVFLHAVEFFEKNSKLGVDKSSLVWYSNKAVAAAKTEFKKIQKQLTDTEKCGISQRDTASMKKSDKTSKTFEKSS